MEAILVPLKPFLIKELPSYRQTDAAHGQSKTTPPARSEWIPNSPLDFTYLFQVKFLCWSDIFQVSSVLDNSNHILS